MQILPPFISRLFSQPKILPSEKEILSLFINAKIREIEILIIEQKSLNQMYEPYKVTHPTHLSKRVDELIQYYLQSDKSTLFSVEHSISLDSLMQMDPKEKINFFFFHPLPDFSIFSLIQKDFELNNSISTIPIEKTSPFYYSDLIVVEDNYNGPMPLNVIHKSDFEKAATFYEEIITKKTVLEIEGPAYFQCIILSSIQKLLTRELTRTFLEKILKPLKPNFFMRLITSVPYNYTIRILPSLSKSEENILGKEVFSIELSAETFMNSLHLSANNGYLTSKFPKYIELFYRLLCLYHYIKKTPLSSKNVFLDHPYEKIALQGERDREEVTENKVRVIFSQLERI